MLVAEKINAGATMREMRQLLPCHFFGGDSYTLLYYAVVSCKQYIVWFRQLR